MNVNENERTNVNELTNVNENERTNVNEPTNVNENDRTNVNENKVNERERERCRTNVNEPTNVNEKCNYRQMADRDEKQILGLPTGTKDRSLVPVISPGTKDSDL
uniref:Uncharacterized protein n=1 Tax=Oryza sativa subsp. japonica TaxID=39947 RepID=Q6Z5M9_ORYSJ|nr:hypothetical protein [Oryza sativa Japonica Group]BAD16053.1 hypothetical protein [Oryza sativa Japonica Group]